MRVVCSVVLSFVVLCIKRGRRPVVDSSVTVSINQGVHIVYRSSHHIRPDATVNSLSHITAKPTATVSVCLALSEQQRL